MKNKYVVVIFVVAFLITGILLCSASRPKYVTIGEDEVVLNTNSGVPYTWEYTIEDNSIVMYKNVKTINKAVKNMVGGPIEMHYTFTGIRPGKTTITFEYKNITDGTVAETVEYNVTVDENLITRIKRLTF